MLTKIGDWWRARNVEINRRELIQCEPKSTLRASLSSLAPNSDLRRWKRWADRCPPHLQELPRDIPDDVPYTGPTQFLVSRDTGQRPTRKPAAIGPFTG